MTDATPPTHAMLEVKWGKSAYQRHALSPGERIVVGSDADVDFSVPHDDALRKKHFALTWDGEHGQLTALESGADVLLGGEPVSEGQVGHGDWVRAGETNFCVYVEGTTPPEPPDPPPSEAQINGQKDAHERLGAVQAPLYAVLDAARDDRVLVLLQETPGRYHCLYEGAKGEAMADAAPYLAEVPPGSRRFDMLLEEGFGHAWGIWLTSSADFIELRRHLRRFLMVKLEGEAEKVYFRYYDPRVMRSFLPTCEGAQLESWFGEQMVTTYYVETEPFGLQSFAGTESRPPRRPAPSSAERRAVRRRLRR